MENRSLLAAGVLAVFVIAGCSEDRTSAPPSGEQVTQSTSAASDAGGDDTATVAPEEASGSPAPTVAVQESGSPLIVTGAQLEAPEGWQVSGVSSDSDSEVVSATSDDGQLVSLRSVRTDSTVDEQITQARESDSEQTVDAPELEADGGSLRGVETVLTASGGELVQLRYFARTGDSLITIDVVTTADQKDTILEHLRSGLTWG